MNRQLLLSIRTNRILILVILAACAAAGLAGVLIGVSASSLSIFFLLLGLVGLIAFTFVALRYPYLPMTAWILLLPLVPTVIGFESPVGLLTIQRILFFALAFVLLGELATGRISVPRTSLDGFILLVVMTRLVALVSSPGGVRALFNFAMEVVEIYGLYYMVVIWINTEEKMQRVFRLVAWAAVILSALTIIEAVTAYNPLDVIFVDRERWWNASLEYRSDEYFQLYRAHALFNHPITMGWYMTIALAMVWLLPALDKKRLRTIGFSRVVTVLVVLVLAAILLSLARSTWVASILAFGLLTWLNSVQRGRVFFVRIFLAILALLVVFVLLLPVLSPSLSQNFFAFVAQSLDLSRRSSLSGRLELVDASLALSWQQPWGYGLYATTLYQDQKALVFGPLSVSLYGFENFYLANLLETGWLGLAATLALYGATLYSAWRAYRKAGTPEQRSLAVILVAALAGNFIVLVGTHYLGTMQQWAWVLFAFSARLRLLVERSPSVNPPA
jgi:hypothetical protein